MNTIISLEAAAAAEPPPPPKGDILPGSTLTF